MIIGGKVMELYFVRPDASDEFINELSKKAGNDQITILTGTKTLFSLCERIQDRLQNVQVLKVNDLNIEPKAAVSISSLMTHPKKFLEEASGTDKYEIMGEIRWIKTGVITLLNNNLVFGVILIILPNDVIDMVSLAFRTGASKIEDLVGTDQIGLDRAAIEIEVNGNTNPKARSAKPVETTSDFWKSRKVASPVW
ncbi:hypothetical protein KKC60_02890 [Patescibacteria group bacterium]|nr:hypothetical protein [Patescibacteria group bacterium]